MASIKTALEYPPEKHIGSRISAGVAQGGVNLRIQLDSPITSIEISKGEAANLIASLARALADLAR